MEKIHSLTGMIDLIGHKTSKEDISERIFYAEEILRDIFESYSISEIRTPALESSNLFKRSVGDASDIVNKELYSFLDKNEKSITLRPEGTASVIRSVIEKKIDNDANMSNSVMACIDWLNILKKENRKVFLRFFF